MRSLTSKSATMPVDRTTTTPFLIRIFPAHGNFHRLNEFDFDLQPKDEINLYSWKDATLGELTTLLAREVVREDAKRPVTSYKFSYRLIYGDPNRARYQTRDIGVVQVGGRSGDSNKTLEEARFVIGDWIDVAVLRPGDRLYDGRIKERDYREPRSAARGGYRGGYGASRAQDERSYRPRDNGRPYDQDRNHDRNGASSRRWESDRGPRRRE